MLARKAKNSKLDRLSSVEPDDHYPLTRTHENGVWMLGNLNTCRFLPLPGSEAKNSKEVHEHDQLEQEGHTGELSIIYYPARACASKGLCDRSWCLLYIYILGCQFFFTPLY